MRRRVSGSWLGPQTRAADLERCGDEREKRLPAILHCQDLLAGRHRAEEAFGMPMTGRRQCGEVSPVTTRPGTHVHIRLRVELVPRRHPDPHRTRRLGASPPAAAASGLPASWNTSSTLSPLVPTSSGRAVRIPARAVPPVAGNARETTAACDAAQVKAEWLSSGTALRFAAAAL